MSQPARFGQAVRAQATMEARLTARRGENLLAMIGLPAAALVFFGLVATPARLNLAQLGDRIDPVLAQALDEFNVFGAGLKRSF